MVSIRVLLIASLALLGTIPGRCATRAAHIAPIRTARLTVETNGMLSVNFSSLADSPPILDAHGLGTVNLGEVSYAAGSDVPGVTVQRAQSGFYVQASVGMQVGNVTNVGGETVSLKAWLQSPANPYGIYLDGVELSTQPAMVDTSVPTGTVTRHQLRIHVPANTSEKESSLQTEISVLVVRN